MSATQLYVVRRLDGAKLSVDIYTEKTLQRHVAKIMQNKRNNQNIKIKTFTRISVWPVAIKT